MKLISMVNKIRDIDLAHGSLSDKYNEIIKYSKFLKQPLKLGMFVPCDLEGNVLKPYQSRCELNCSCGEEAVKDCKEDRYNEYQEAKDRVLFEDCVYDEEMSVVRYLNE
jgi:hypothetical protein